MSFVYILEKREIEKWKKGGRERESYNYFVPRGKLHEFQIRHKHTHTHTPKHTPTPIPAHKPTHTYLHTSLLTYLQKSLHIHAYTHAYKKSHSYRTYFFVDDLMKINVFVKTISLHRHKLTLNCA